MQSVFSLVNRAALVVAGALALGACSRAEYAMLPKSPAYLGTKSVAVAPRPAAQPAPAVAVAASEPAAPVATPALVASVVPRPATVAKAAPAVAPAPAVATVPVTAPAPAETAAPVAVATTAPEAASAAPKLNMVQRLALKKVSKKLEKLAAKSPQFKQHDATASTSRVSGNLRSALIFGIVGLLLTLFSGVSSIFAVIGVILIIIGLVFLLLWVLDEA